MSWIRCLFLQQFLVDFLVNFPCHPVNLHKLLAIHHILEERALQMRCLLCKGPCPFASSCLWPCSAPLSCISRAGQTSVPGISLHASPDLADVLENVHLVLWVLLLVLGAFVCLILMEAGLPLLPSEPFHVLMYIIF